MIRIKYQKLLSIYSTLNTQNNSIWILHVLHADLLNAITSVSRHTSCYSLQSNNLTSTNLVPQYHIQYSIISITDLTLQFWVLASSHSTQEAQLGGQGSPKVIGNVTIRQIAYDFLFGFNRNYLVPFSRYGELFVEICQLQPTIPAFGAPVGVIPVEFLKDFWREKTRVPGLSCGIVCVFLCLAILVQHRLVTDTETDTRSWHIPCKAQLER